MSQAREELARAAGDAARRIVSVLRDNPVRSDGSYPLASVHRQLAEQQRTLWAAIECYPLSVAMDVDGRPDQLGAQLATLMSLLAQLLVFYRGLDDIPPAMREQAHLVLKKLLRAANGAVALAGPDSVA